MLRAAIVEKSKEHREYIRASLTGINMDIQVSEYADEYDYLDDLNEDASSFDILLLNTTIHREGDGLELAAKVRARSRKVMICFITDSQRYYAEAFSVFATGYLLYPFDVSELHNCITFFYYFFKYFYCFTSYIQTYIIIFYIVYIFFIETAYFCYFFTANSIYRKDYFISILF